MTTWFSTMHALLLTPGKVLRHTLRLTAQGATVMPIEFPATTLKLVPIPKMTTPMTLFSTISLPAPGAPMKLCEAPSAITIPASSLEKMPLCWM